MHVDIIDAGDPVECAKAYCAAGADQLALLDITATVENRSTMLDVVKKVAAATTVPFTVGGGIGDVKTAAAVLNAGANRVSISSAAFRKPDLIPELIKEFGVDAVTAAIDVDVNAELPSGYEVYIDGGRTATGADAVEFAKKLDGFGVNVILPTSKSGDGARTGYDLPVIRAMANACSAQIVASGGAGAMQHFVQLFVTPWTAAHKAPLSMEFSRQEYWSGLPFLSVGNFPDPGIESGFLHCRQILYHLTH